VGTAHHAEDFTSKEGRKMKNLVGIITLVAVLTLFGCNTMQGVGKDIEQDGKAIQKATK
jgi:predicted small secreted protein